MELATSLGRGEKRMACVCTGMDDACEMDYRLRPYPNTTSHIVGLVGDPPCLCVKADFRIPRAISLVSCDDPHFCGRRCGKRLQDDGLMSILDSQYLLWYTCLVDARLWPRRSTIANEWISETQRTQFSWCAGKLHRIWMIQITRAILLDSHVFRRMVLGPYLQIPFDKHMITWSTSPSFAIYNGDAAGCQMIRRYCNVMGQKLREHMCESKWWLQPSSAVCRIILVWISSDKTFCIRFGSGWIAQTNYLIHLWQK